MELIGLTGGAGAGKSAILSYLCDRYNARVMQADRIAEELMQKGTECNRRLAEAFQGYGVFLSDGTPDRGRLAELIFREPKMRLRINEIVHPAVKEYVIAEADREKKAGRFSYLFLEAALLLEDGYDRICDEIWYIYASEDVRARRLQKTRGYSDEKIRGIFASQLPEEEFRRRCRHVIDNNGTKEAAFAQIDRLLRNGRNQSIE